MGHGETHVPVVSILEPEHLGADGVPAAAVAPDLGGVQDGHGHLLPADGVHLLADDPVHAVEHALAERQPDVDAGRELPDETGAQHQLVAARLRVRGVLPQGGHERLRQPHLLRVFRLVGALHARRIDEALDGLAAEDVRLHDLGQVLLLHAGVPDVLRVDDDHRPVAALREAAGLVDANVTLAAGLDDLAAQVLDEALDVGLRRAVVAAGAHEHVNVVLAHQSSAPAVAFAALRSATNLSTSSRMALTISASGGRPAPPPPGPPSRAPRRPRSRPPPRRPPGATSLTTSMVVFRNKELI